MKPGSSRKAVVATIVLLLWSTVILSLVVLDHYHHAWMALLLYGCVYVAVAAVKRRAPK